MGSANPEGGRPPASQPLTRDEGAALDRSGYVVFLSLLDGRRLDRLRAAFDRAAGSGTTGTRHFDGRSIAPARPDHSHGDGDDGHDLFAELAGDEKVQSAARHVLGVPFEVFQLAGREPTRGFGQQGLHTDWLVRVRGPSSSS